MRIKIVLCTADNRYAQKLDYLFDKMYADKTEMNIFEDAHTMSEHIARYGADLALLGEELEGAGEIMSGLRCVCGMLVDKLYVSGDAGTARIAKYQRVDMIYKALLDIYSRGGRVKQISRTAVSDRKSKIYMFVSPCGGTGTTTIARAFARKCAYFEKVLYLDLGLMNCHRGGGEGKHGLDEIIMALKSRRNVLPLKLASAVSTDDDRVDTYAACISNPFGIFEMTREDIRQMFEGIVSMGNYQKVVVDVGNYITEKETELFRLADEIICVVGDTGMGKTKCMKFLELLGVVERKEGVKVMRKVALFKNRSGREGLPVWEEMGCRDAGWFPDMHIDDYEACIERIARSDAFDAMS